MLSISNLGDKFDLSISDLKDNFGTNITDLRDIFSTGLNGLKDGFISAITNLGDIYSTGITGLRDIFSTGITSLRDNVVSAITGFGTFILDGIKKLFLLPEGYMEEKIDYLRSRFSFIDSIISTASGLINAVSASAAADGPAPSIVMNLNIRGTVKRVTVIDLSWYAPYKSYGDKVMSAMIWVFFIWRVAVHLPGIIAGTAGNAASVFSSGFNLATSHSSSDSSKDSGKKGDNK